MEFKDLPIIQYNDPVPTGFTGIADGRSIAVATIYYLNCLYYWDKEHFQADLLKDHFRTSKLGRLIYE